MATFVVYYDVNRCCFVGLLVGFTHLLTCLLPLASVILYLLFFFIILHSLSFRRRLLREIIMLAQKDSDDESTVSGLNDGTSTHTTPYYHTITIKPLTNTLIHPISHSINTPSQLTLSILPSDTQQYTLIKLLTYPLNPLVPLLLLPPLNPPHSHPFIPLPFIPFPFPSTGLQNVPDDILFNILFEKTLFDAQLQNVKCLTNGYTGIYTCKYPPSQTFTSLHITLAMWCFGLCPVPYIAGWKPWKSPNNVVFVEQLCMDSTMVSVVVDVVVGVSVSSLIPPLLTFSLPPSLSFSCLDAWWLGGCDSCNGHVGRRTI